MEKSIKQWGLSCSPPKKFCLRRRASERRAARDSGGPKKTFFGCGAETKCPQGLFLLVCFLLRFFPFSPRSLPSPTVPLHSLFQSLWPCFFVFSAAGHGPENEPITRTKSKEKKRKKQRKRK